MMCPKMGVNRTRNTTNSKAIDLNSSSLDFPSKDEIEILLKSLKPGKELPPLVDTVQLDDYADQLLAEIYLDKVMKGNLSFNTTNWVVELNGNTYLRFVR